MLRKTCALISVLATMVVLVGSSRALAATQPAESPAAETHAPAEAHGDAGHHIGAPTGANAEKPEEFKSDLALFTLVVFALLLLILWKFAWRPIIASLEKREETIANHIAEAQRMHEEAKLLLAQYDQKLAAAAADVREMMEQARRDGEAAKAAILAEAKAGAEAERARALRDIDAAADAAMESLAERSAQLAVELAGKILKFKLTPDDHARLIQDAMNKFPAAASSAN